MTAVSVQPPHIALEADNGILAIALSGDWTAASGQRAEAALETACAGRMVPPDVRLDGEDMTALDTVGGWVIVKHLRALEQEGASVSLGALAPRHRELLDHLRATASPSPSPKPRLPLFLRPFDAMGRGLFSMGGDLVATQAVQGRILAALGALLAFRGKVRLPAFVNQVERVVYNAVPIVVLIALVVGAIITQQSILQLRNFGAAIYVVDLAAILMLREVGLLLAAIMVAGRSGSAITAEIGAMRMREELDALRVMGVDPYQALILPRVLALVIGMPLLAFIGALAGLAGAAIVSMIYGGIPLSVFIDRLQGALSLQSFLVGMIKAPIMGFIIALIATNEGFKVSGSSESLGRHTTSSVVKAIFMVIVADGLFAIFFTAIGV